MTQQLNKGETIFYLLGMYGLNLAGWKMPQNPEEALMRREELWKRLKNLITDPQQFKWIEEMLEESQEAVGIFPIVSIKDNSFLNLNDPNYLQNVSNNGRALNNYLEMRELFQENPNPEIETLTQDEVNEFLEDPAGNLYEILANLFESPIL